ncbi:MAG: helix-turn-helix domain-containing protein [Verrucomicrobia bacterium]|nr:helix-turn-helix domain-containing protein [Verrucomicrobiota bacterium]
MKIKSYTEELYGVANRLAFEPHRIWLDPTGRYDEPLDREFPFIIKLFHYRHHDFTPGLSWHERLELFMPLDGDARMQMGKRQVELAPGEVLVVENLKLHMTVDTPGLNTRVIVISFLPEFVHGPGLPPLDHVFLLPFYAQPAGGARVLRRDGPVLPQVHQAVAQLLRSYFDRSDFFQAACKVYLLEMLYHLARHFRAVNFPRSELIRQQERVAKVKPLFDFVAHHYAEPMTLKQGAMLTKMSLPQFMKAFKKVAGMTFVSYLTLVRLANAIPLLKRSSLPIGEVAKQVGFSDQGYFDRRFKAVFYQTPRAFRQTWMGR